MIRTATEIREDDNGGAVEMRDNGDGRQGQRRRQRRTSMVAEMRENRDGYGGRGDARTAIKEMWDDRDGEMGWNNGDRLGKYQQGKTTKLRAYRHSNNLGVRATTDLNVDLGRIWRLCVSYCNINKITH